MATKIQEGIEKAKQELVQEKEKKESEEVSQYQIDSLHGLWMYHSYGQVYSVGKSA